MKKKIHYLKKEMSLDTVTRSLKRKLNFAPPARRRPAGCRPGGPPRGGEDWGSSARPCPPLVPGRTPVCSLPPPTPPGISRLELEGNEECAKFRKAAAGAREAAGPCTGGSGGRIAPGGRADTWPLPPPALAGGPGLRGPTRQGQRHPGPVESGRRRPWL